ncbi:MAG TPA: TIR domain-containing protein [Candidatus Angelobacter sp.]|nr:TIR domain-containing protein [Candidatus Angelobacter sp.]
MEIFVSWSGPRSGALAEALRSWLPKVVNAFKPWLSSADIDKGSLWHNEISSKLASAKAGIICITPNNLNSPWLLFEAGALSKTVGKTCVCTLLLGIKPTDLTGPLSHFQTTIVNKEEILRLVKDLNGWLGDAAMETAQLEETFDLWWPKLEKSISSLPSDGPEKRQERTEREMLEELLNLARKQDRDQQKWNQQVNIQFDSTEGLRSELELRAVLALEGLEPYIDRIITMPRTFGVVYKATTGDLLGFDAPRDVSIEYLARIIKLKKAATDQRSQARSRSEAAG